MTNKRKATKQPKARPPVKRQTRKFQLRLEHPTDAHVKEVLDYARTQRREVTLIREAIALYWALEQGDIEALYKKFPQYRGGNGDGRAGQLDEIKELLRTIKEQIVTKGTQSMQSLPSATGKQITAPSFDLPTFDDDDDLPTLKLKKNATADAANRFLKSMSQVQ